MRQRVLILAAGVLAAVLAGCQAQPRMVVEQLPIGSILAHSSASPPRPAVNDPPPGEGEAAWRPLCDERPWRWIVLHHSASEVGSAAIFDREHRARGWDGLGYHFVIDNGQGAPDGQIEVGPRWWQQKWGAHTGSTPDNAYNNYGIGICLVGDFSRQSPTQAQLRSLQTLLAYLMDRYRIDASCVIGHRDAPNANTECPGDRFYDYLNRTLRPSLRQGIARR
jgi:hypothetical protein